MFCDLVGSTGLSTGMDPEDLRDVIASFQSRCIAAIRRYDGFVAKYMGDGILVYFGYPRAMRTRPSARCGRGSTSSMRWWS
jgi:class 3 adenylate cyclase